MIKDAAAEVILEDENNSEGAEHPAPLLSAPPSPCAEETLRVSPARPRGVAASAGHGLLRVRWSGLCCVTPSKGEVFSSPQKTLTIIEMK